MKEFKFIQGISLRVILLFGVAFLGTFFSEYLSSTNAFGDYTETIHYTKEYAYRYGRKTTEDIDRFGARHIWYVVCMFILFLLQLISLIWFVVRRVNDLSDSKK